MWGDSARSGPALGSAALAGPLPGAQAQTPALPPPSCVTSENVTCGTSLEVVQWLRRCTSTAGLRVRSLVGEIRSHVPRGMAKKNKVTCVSFLGG